MATDIPKQPNPLTDTKTVRSHLENILIFPYKEILSEASKEEVMNTIREPPSKCFPPMQ